MFESYPISFKLCHFGIKSLTREASSPHHFRIHGRWSHCNTHMDTRTKNNRESKRMGESSCRPSHVFWRVIHNCSKWSTGKWSVERDPTGKPGSCRLWHLLLNTGSWTVLYSTVYYNTELHCITLYYTTIQYIKMHYTTLCYTELHCITLHYIVQHCTVLFCTRFPKMSFTAWPWSVV